MNTLNSTHAPHNATNLVDTAAANGTFKTFGKAIEQAGLGGTLRSPGPFTVFAPTDAAFDKLPAGRLDELMKPENKQELAALLNYHVVNGRRSMSDVGKWEKARTVNGQQAPITLADGKVLIDGARVTAGDIDSSNGVLHGIDKVNIPTKQ
ncbi:MAG: fasciclin domain-containing protein [Xanthomonadales bacterium]|nr:fasciclin domain-containing protein [Xanthomonadales bacterium]